jgi:hypothetical protein
VAVGLVGAVAVVGVALGLQTLMSAQGHPSVVREAPFPGAWKAAAGFGPIEAERVERSASHLVNAHHGHGDAPHEQIVVSVRLANRGAQGVAFSPGQFRLLVVGPGTTTTAIDPNAKPDSIGPGRTLRTDVSFLVHRADRRFALVFDDALAARQLRIALGVIPAPNARTGAAGETE